MVRHIALALLCLLPGAAQPGPWPRAAGTGFAAAELVQGDWGSAYLEWGLGRDLTFGAKLGRGRDGAGEALVFLSRPLSLPGGLPEGWVASAALGAGMRRDGGGAQRAVLRPALSLGAGFERLEIGGLEVIGPGQGGWWSLDLAQELAGRGSATKLDAVLGVNRPGRGHWLVELRLHHDDAGLSAALAPSVVTPVGKGAKLRAGAVLPIDGSGTARILLGGWWEF